MSSVLPERRLLQPRTPFIRVERRSLASIALACAALFALSFAFGRVLSPARDRGTTVPAFAATQASADIPVSLSAAPAIRLASPAVVVVHAPKPARAAPAAKPATPTVAAAVPVLTQPTTPVTPVASRPTVAGPPAPAKPSAPAVKPTPAKAPASTQRSGGAAAPKHGGGVSFDSSG